MHRVAMWHVIALAIALIFGLSGAVADEPGHRATAERYLEETNVPTRLTALIHQVRAKQIAALEKWYVPSETRNPAKTYIDQATKLLSEELSWERLKEDFIGAYVAVYSQVELEQLIGFYQSPLGKKYLEKRPQLVAAGLEITERRLRALVPRFEALSESLNEALGKARAGPATDQ